MRDFSIDLVWAKIQGAITVIGGWLGYFLGGLDGDDEADTPTEPKPLGVTVAITGGSVYVRVGNGTNYRIITTVKAGMTCDHVATALNGWNAIVINGQVGWVSG